MCRKERGRGLESGFPNGCSPVSHKLNSRLAGTNIVSNPHLDLGLRLVLILCMVISILQICIKFIIINQHWNSGDQIPLIVHQLFADMGASCYSIYSYSRKGIFASQLWNPGSQMALALTHMYEGTNSYATPHHNQVQARWLSCSLCSRLADWLEHKMHYIRKLLHAPFSFFNKKMWRFPSAWKWGKFIRQKFSS